jgi:hypothetical protein
MGIAETAAGERDHVHHADELQADTYKYVHDNVRGCNRVCLRSERTLRPDRGQIRSM